MEKQHLHEKILELQKIMGDLDADYKISVDEKDSATKEALDNVKQISRLEFKLQESTKENMELQVFYRLSLYTHYGFGILKRLRREITTTTFFI